MIFWTFAAFAYGQRLQFGMIGGTGLTADFPATDFSGSADDFGNAAYHYRVSTGPRSLIFGGVIEGRITERFSIEANVLHRPMKTKSVYTEFHPGGTDLTSVDQFTRVRTWEFPVLFKYTLPARPSDERIRPFMEAGPSFRTQEDASAAQPSRTGVSAGAGAAIRFGHYRVSPTLRYTRWARDFYSYGATKRDQLEFLTSFSYETEASSLHVGGHALDLGAVAGLSATHELAENFRDLKEHTRILAGLTAQLNVTPHIAMEVNAIYKPFRAQAYFGNFAVLTWQFPVLAKYRWNKPANASQWTPFLEAGPSFRLSGNFNGYDPSFLGGTVGGGIERRVGGVRLEPTLRYTRWGADRNRVRTNLNALELVFGVSF